MFISITYIEINTINATNIYVVDVCTKSKFYRKKHLIELIEIQLRKKLKIGKILTKPENNSYIVHKAVINCKRLKRKGFGKSFVFSV